MKCWFVGVGLYVFLAWLGVGVVGVGFRSVCLGIEVVGFVRGLHLSLVLCQKCCRVSLICFARVSYWDCGCRGRVGCPRF